MAATHTEVERAVFTLAKCFFTYSSEEGKKDSLNFAEFSKLVTKEFPNLMKDVSLEQKMKELDINKDNELTFNEFWKLTGEVGKAVKKDMKAKK